jgi:tRNA nucleotidyltransferase (CCA-adding enzyme)
MKELDLLKFVHPNLKAVAEAERLFGAISETLTWFKLLYLEVKIEKWFLYFLGLLDRLKPAAAEETLERLSAPARMRERVRKSRMRCHEVLFLFNKEPGLLPSRVYDLLRPLDTEAVLFIMAKATQEKARKHISFYLTHLREVRITLTGDDLKAMGLPPGPRYKKLLAELMDAKLDGLVRNKEEEVEFVKQAVNK